MWPFTRKSTAPEAPRGDDLTRIGEEVARIRAELATVKRQVEELDQLQLSREMSWRELSDKMLRYLKRVQELDRREGDSQDPNQRALFELKFGGRK